MTKTALQALINRNIADNITGDISAQDVREALIDITDSVDFPSTSALAPAVRSFSIENQPTKVDAGTTLSGTKTFLYNISEPNNVDGNLTLLQAASTLSSSVNPSGSSVSQAINNVTLANGGDSVVFTLRGTAVVGAGGAQFEGTFTVTALTDDEYIYISDEADSDASDVVIANATRLEFSGVRQDLTVPTFAGNRFITILQRASEPAITQIIIDSLNQFDAFTKTDDAITINGALFDAYVSTNAMVGSIVSGDTITVIR